MKGRKWTIWTIWTIPRHRGLNQNMTGCLTLSFSVLVRSPSVGASFCVREGLKFFKKYGIFHNMGVRGHTDSWGIKKLFTFFHIFKSFSIAMAWRYEEFPLNFLEYKLILWQWQEYKNNKIASWHPVSLTRPVHDRAALKTVWRQCGAEENRGE